jgi:hypothetical protein
VIALLAAQPHQLDDTHIRSIHSTVVGMGLAALEETYTDG